MSDIGCESNARGTEKAAIGVIEFGRSLRFAEANGSKVIASVDLPESVLHALADLVDAISREFGAVEADRRLAEANRPRTMCRWHIGQIADYCGPCRSEKLAAGQ